MSQLTIYPETAGEPIAVLRTHEEIARELGRIGVLFERWTADRELEATATPDEVIEAYREPIDRLMQKYGFQSVDVVSMHPEHPQKDALRDKFLHEHTHSDFEVRFFVDGEGLFYIRKDGKVYATLCTRGDLISVPANTTHWFDMGPRPTFKAIRLFTTPEGWVANFTGDKIADRFPRLENTAG
ncbi:MAG TPA: acireductone dioxygenase [Nevskiales bacterium]|nr:acireductone dioxygenase [Nevskiales bacterium]